LSLESRVLAQLLGYTIEVELYADALEAIAGGER